MASINIGTFRGYSNSSNYGRYTCYLQYDSITRSGNNVTINNLRVYMERYSSGYTTNRLAICAGYNGSTNNLKNNATISSSGSNSASSYTINLGSPTVATNGTGFAVYVNIQSTGASSNWTNFQSDGLVYSGTPTASGASPTAPSAPSSCSIPSSAAPDQTITVSWGASSGGSNGVSGYQLAYSKDGGSSYSYLDVSGTSKSLDLNSLGFVHGSVLKCAIRAYSTVNNTRYYSGWTYSGSTTTSFAAPSTPSSVTIPSSIAPDKTTAISWSAASGGTNGVKGYQYQWSKDGGSTWSTAATTTGTSINLNLNSNGFVQGSKLAFRVRSYTTGQSANYYSGWKTSGTTTTSFVAPSAPRSVAITTDMAEPIPTGTYKGSWLAPTSTGTNGVSGYRVQWLKNGSNFGDEYDVSSTSASKAVTEDTIQPGDILSYKVRAYTIGQNTRYYSDYTTAGSIEIVSDKFIYISQNGGSFIKYKAFISINGGSFTEIKKEKLKVI